MGLVKEDDNFSSGRSIEYKKGAFVDYDAIVEGYWLYYHTSWNCLMPVLNKLWNLKSFMDFESELSIKFEEIFNIDFTLCEFFQGDITSIYSRAVEFIEWYNDNK